MRIQDLLSRKVVGVLGGAFDPVHDGHMDMANHLVRANHVDEVWLMPSYSGKDFKSSAVDRYEMCRLAVTANDDTRIKVCDFEIELMLESGTVGLMDALRTVYEHKFYFVIGTDQANNIHKWVNAAYLLSRNDFIVVRRPGLMSYPLPWRDWYRREDRHIYTQTRQISKISSTEIRRRLDDPVANREFLGMHMEDEVFDYIVRERLYGVH